MYQYKTIFTFLFSVFLITLGVSQDDIQFPKGEAGYKMAYERNIKKSRINGVYIPKNLDEAFGELDALSPEKAKSKFKNAPEDIIATKLHFGLGRWISVFWNFEEGSRYVEYLRGLGLVDRDHMIQFTIVSYHRHKNNRPLEIEKRVEEYKVIMAKRMEEYKRRRTVIHTEKRKIKKG